MSRATGGDGASHDTPGARLGVGDVRHRDNPRVLTDREVLGVAACPID
jgi:hypothetical protein